jgi:transcriptional regulator with XRE-family HTH domain
LSRERILLPKDRLFFARISPSRERRGVQMKKPFGTWLSAKLIELDMKPADITRAAGIDSGVLSNIINNKRLNPSVETCKLLAKAMNIPLEEVYRAADILPENKAVDPITEAVLTLMGTLDAKERKEVLEYARFRVKSAERNETVHNSGNSGKHQPRTAQV